MLIIAATGHRPDKLGGYHPEITNRLRLLAHRYLVERKPDVVISGMALGWDTAVAGAALLAQIPLVAAIPFEGQELRWPESAQRVYRELLAACVRRHVVCPGPYAPEKMQRRNVWMVDHCNRVVALWNGSPGGTANCVRYARSQPVPVDNLWSEF